MKHFMVYPRTTAGGFAFPEWIPCEDVGFVLDEVKSIELFPFIFTRGVDGAVVEINPERIGGGGRGVVVITVPLLTPFTPLTCAVVDDTKVI